MHIFHCWHKIEGSERKIKSNRKCQLSNPYIAPGGYVLYTIRYKCCECGKEKESDIYRDYQVDRGLEYLERE